MMVNKESNLKKWLYRAAMTFPIFFVLVAAVGIVRSFAKHPIDWITVGNAVAFGLVWLLVLGIFIGRNPNWIRRKITNKAINLVIALYIAIELAIWLASKLGW